MSYSRTYRNELYTFIKKYPEELTVYYNNYGDMDTFSGTFTMKDNILYLCLSMKEDISDSLTVKSLIELLESCSDKNVEVSTYFSFQNGYNDFHCNMPIDLIYFK
jgi:hypothetical protein